MPLSAYAVTKAYFAGFAFTSDYADIRAAFPFTATLLNERDTDGVPRLERELGRRIAGAKLHGADLVTDALGDYRSGQAVSLAFALDWENVAREKIAGATKLVIDLHAEILVFDFAAKKVIGAYPVSVEYRDAVDGDASDDYVRNAVAKLYYGSSVASIFDRFVERLDTVEIKPSYGRYLRISDVTLEDKATDTLARFHIDPSIFSSFAARSFAKFLSSNQNVAMIPYSVGHAIGNKMAARFANGDVYQLTLPDADFAVHLTIRGFKRVELDHNDHETAWAYGSFIRVKVEQPQLAKVYLDAPFKFGAVKLSPASQTQIEDWSAFQESLLSLFDQLTKQVSVQDKNWLHGATDVEGVSGELADLARIIATCR